MKHTGWTIYVAVLLVFSGCGSKPDKGDLVVTACAAPVNICNGSLIEVSNRVANYGERAVGEFSVGIYLSSDPEISAINDTLLLSRTVSGLEPGEESYALSLAGIPYGISGDKCYIGVVADSDYIISEADEGNNILSTCCKISEPPDSGLDLSITDVSAPALINEYDSFSVEVMIENTSSLDLGPLVLTAYMSEDDNITIADFCLNNEVIASLPANSSTQITVDVDYVDFVRYGMYYIGAIVDSTGAIAEVSETNNALASITQTQYGTLIMPDAYEDDDMAAQAKTANLDEDQYRSLHSTSDIDWVIFTVPENTVMYVGLYNTTSYPVYEVYESDGVTAVQCYDENSRLYLFENSGTYYLKIYGSQEVAEYRLRLNSKLVGGLDIDLCGGYWDWEDSTITALPRMEIITGFWIGNLGEDFCKPYNVTGYISRDATIDTGDELIGVKRVSPGFYGDVYDFYFEYTMPQNWPPGVYYVGLIVDTDNEIEETDETNNASTALLKVFYKLDVKVVSLTTVSAAMAGDTIHIDCQIVSNIPEFNLYNSMLYFCRIRDGLPDYDSRIHLGMVPQSGTGWDIKLPRNLETGAYSLMLFCDMTHYFERFNDLSLAGLV